MNKPRDTRDREAAIIAASITFGCALLILVLLFVLNIGDSRRALAEVSTPELQDDEEIFLEPDFIVEDNPGQEDAENIDEAAPQPPGEPDPAEVEQPVKVVKNEKPPKEEPVSNKQELVSSKEKSDVKTSTPKLSAEEEKRLASMSGKLKSDNNGARSGKESANSGIGGDGISVQGSLNGRKMESCSSWKVKLTQKTTVKVQVTVNADGNVTAATAISGGTPNLRAQCEKMARTSKWTKKAGAAPANGTITFTIVPN